MFRLFSAILYRIYLLFKLYHIIITIPVLYSSTVNRFPLWFPLLHCTQPSKRGGAGQTREEAAQGLSSSFFSNVVAAGWVCFAEASPSTPGSSWTTSSRPTAREAASSSSPTATEVSVCLWPAPCAVQLDSQLPPYMLAAAPHVRFLQYRSHDWVRLTKHCGCSQEMVRGCLASILGWSYLTAHTGRQICCARRWHRGVSIHWTGLLDWTTGMDYWTHPYACAIAVLRSVFHLFTPFWLL